MHNFFKSYNIDNCNYRKATELIILSLVADVQYEPRFGSYYAEEEISPSLMALWRDPPEIDVSLHLPLKNEFIPCDFSIRADNTQIDPANESLPICIFDEPLMKYWYKLDSTFKLPRANTYFRINLKGAYLNLRSCLLTELYIHLLKDELNEIIYQVNFLSFVILKFSVSN